MASSIFEHEEKALDSWLERREHCFETEPWSEMVLGPL